MKRRHHIDLVSVLVIVGAFSYIVFGTWTFLTKQTEDATRSDLEITTSFIRSYAEEHGRLPKSLAEMWVDVGKTGVRVDGWNQPLSYSVLNSNVVELVSAGRDGQFGTGDDIILRTNIWFHGDLIP